mmetsp:Transcript_22435/g.47197  ORF Transcript_22435/g.47197 Transcript_22435/m.47197 type:complete len:92 (+) Transcript_22435:120-395(+)|eukprot:CAMPEP_0197485278 /NCGR_PEP_ID=MMETSP1311-20131121/265_1 /TAXON_ID=464262 /ORGANISM="Genus nov. species nov., Strain RCC856" /LENGTH=91 /DNA_ID=CAMNT_0043027957 /DNA_START=254 /DNA_END=529 /DNA_ORIENTATION=+
MASPAKAFEVRAEWSIVDDTCEGNVKRFQYQSSNKNLPESFAGLKTESNRLITGWMNGKKMVVEEIDVLEEKIPDTDDEEEGEPADKKQKI